MDIETRAYLKKMFEDAGRAQLVMSVLQRFAPQMSEAEVEALKVAYWTFQVEARDYLVINDDGQLVVTDPEELKKLGLEAPSETPAVPADTPEAEEEEELPEPVVESPATKKPVGKKAKDGYT